MISRSPRTEVLPDVLILFKKSFTVWTISGWGSSLSLFARVAHG